MDGGSSPFYWELAVPVSQAVLDEAVRADVSADAACTVQTGKVKRILIIDHDIHHGNGR